MNRRTALKMTAAASVATLVAPNVSLANEDGLSWTHFPAGENGFYRAPVLVSGPSEAVLIDGGLGPRHVCGSGEALPN